MSPHISAFDSEEVKSPAQTAKPVPDAGDAASVRDKVRNAKAEDERRRETLKAFMNTANGRKWFYNFLVSCHCFTNPYTASDRSTAFNCGEMNIGLPILADLNQHCLEEYLLMMKENTGESNG